MTDEKLNWAKMGKIEWAFSVLSDAQASLELGHIGVANELINDAKHVLLGRYEETDGGFTIRIFKKTKRSRTVVQNEDNPIIEFEPVKKESE